VVVIVVFVQNHRQYGGEAPVPQKQVRIEEKQAYETIKQTQAPHTTKLAPGATATKGAQQAITKWIDHQTKIGAMGGPVKDASCTPVSGTGSDRIALKCTIKASDVSYDFRGVVQPKSGKVTYCQKVEYGSIYNQPLPPLVGACT
jgi:hypothetical protein